MKKTPIATSLFDLQKKSEKKQMEEKANTINH